LFVSAAPRLRREVRRGRPCCRRRRIRRLPVARLAGVNHREGRRPCGLIFALAPGGGYSGGGNAGSGWRVEDGPRHPRSLLRKADYILRSNRSAGSSSGRSGTAYEALGPLGAFVRSAARSSRCVGSCAESTMPRRPVPTAAWCVRPTPGIRGNPRFRPECASWTRSRGPMAMVSSGSCRNSSGRRANRGASWQRVAIAPTGAVALAVDAEAGSWSKECSARALRPGDLCAGAAGRCCRSACARPSRTPERAPDCGALVEGRAIVTSGRYYEVARDHAGGRGVFGRGNVDGTLRASELRPPRTAKRSVRRVRTPPGGSVAGATLPRTRPSRCAQPER